MTTAALPGIYRPVSPEGLVLLYVVVLCFSARRHLFDVKNRNWVKVNLHQ